MSANGSLFCVLVDPDRASIESLRRNIPQFEKAGVDFLMVGSTYLQDNGSVGQAVDLIRAVSELQIVLFPGAAPASYSLASGADGFLSPMVLTSDDPWFLKGWHVEASRVAVEVGLQPIPIGYLLIGDRNEEISAISATSSEPIAFNDCDRARNLALASSLFGHLGLYLDAGSGAARPVASQMIKSVREITSSFLVVGGGIGSPREVEDCVRPGADIVVVGTAFEGQIDEILLSEMVDACKHTAREMER